MARTGGGVNALAVTTAAAGAFLIWTGIRNVGVVDGLRAITSGKLPEQGAQVGASLGTAVGDAVPKVVDAIGGKGAQLAAAARRYIGKPYRWGASGPDAFDCSGLITRALRDVGKNVRRLYSADLLVWSGATTIQRDQLAAGDLVCWVGHCGIAVSSTRLIHAPSAGRDVVEAPIWWTPAPVLRRVKW